MTIERFTLGKGTVLHSHDGSNLENTAQCFLNFKWADFSANIFSARILEFTLNLKFLIGFCESTEFKNNFRIKFCKLKQMI